MISKSSCIFLLTAALFCLTLQAEDKIPVYKYTFSARTITWHSPEYEDPDGTKLTDGKSSLDKIRNPHCVWCYKDFNEKPLQIDFTLDKPSSIDTIRILQFRWKQSYGLKDVRAIGQTASGSKVSLGIITLNQPYDLPEGEPYISPFEIKSLDDTPVTSVQLIFRGTGGYLGLDEVEFFGKAEEAAAPETAHPLEILAKNAKPGLRIYKHGRYLILENDYSIYAIDPRYGGCVSLAWDKLSQRNLVRFADIGNDYGPLFQDRFYPGGYAVRDSYLFREYRAEIITDMPDKKQVRVWGTGQGGVFSNVEISKIYTLDKGSSVLSADITITNGQENVVPLRYGYWFTGGLYSPNSYKRIFAGATKTEIHLPERETSTSDFPSGWIGGIDGDVGLAITFPYESSKELYYWGQNNFQGTIEVKMGIYPIKAGGSTTYACAVAPFNGIGTPDKVNAWAAASIGKESIRLRLFRPGTYILRVQEGKRQNDKGIFGVAKEYPLKEGSVLAEVPYKTANQLVRIELVREGNVVFYAEKSDGVYNIAADSVRLPEADGAGTALNLDFHSKDFATPHFDWGGKFAVGKPKVLAIFNLHGGIREAIELSSRFDMDLTTNYIAGLWSLSGHVMSLNPNTCFNELGKKLLKHYDVIIVSAGIWGLFPEHVKLPLLEQIKNGTGLILTGAENLPKELSEQFAAAEGKNYRFTWHWNNSKHPLAACLPLAEMPMTRFMRYELKNGAEPIVMSDNSPVVAKGTLGKGNVFLCAWETQKPNPKAGLYNSPSSFMLPFMIKAVTEEHHYFEYQYALMARLVQAAWGKDNGVAAEITAKKDAIEAAIVSTAAQEATFHLTLRNKFSEIVFEKLESISLKAGKTQLKLEYPVPFMTGRHFADVVISNEAGALWWGSATFSNEQSSIDKVALEDKIYHLNENVEGSVYVKGEGSVTISVSDTFGNVTAQSSGASFKLPLSDVTTPNARIITELRDKDGHILDRKTTRINLASPPDPRLFHVEFGWAGINEKAPQYLADTFIAYLRDTYFLTVNSATYSNLDFQPYMNSWRDAGIRFSLAAAGTDTGGKRPFDMQKMNGPKNELIRKPCLSAPGYIDKLTNAFSKFNKDVQLGVLNVGGPDESNLFGGWDGCFSEDCKNALRQYLKKEYASLEELNASWETSFQSWDDVEARTVEEIRKDGCKSFASWVDHRTFNDIRRAECICAIQKAIHAKYPDMGYSLSGTSETNPWNAWDWYLLMDELHAFSAYGGEQTIQRLSFAKRPIDNMPWTGYDKDAASEEHYLMTHLMFGCRGLSIYGCNFYVNPDWTLPEVGIGFRNVLKKYLNGIAELVRTSTFSFDPIALHYSPASIKVDWITGLDNTRKAAVTGMSGMISDAGCNYAYVAYRQLEQEDVGRKHSIIMLPMSQALSDGEIAGLERFVANGGILIADMLPGIYDQHGKPRSSSSLLNLFGIKAQGTYLKEETTLNGKEGALKDLSMQVPAYEKGLIPGAAVSKATIGNQPMVLVNHHGKGKTIYLGCAMLEKYGELGGMRKNQKNLPMSSIIDAAFAALLKEANVAPQVSVSNLVATNVMTRTIGPALIAGVIRDIKQTQDYDVVPHDATVSLRKKAHVYDLLTHAYIGYTDSFQYRFAPTTQALFLLLPYKPTALNAKLDGETVTLSMDTTEPGPRINHIFRVEVTRPDGQPSRAHSMLVFGSGTTGTFAFKRPLNSPIGTWTLTATDVATGLKTTISL